MIEAIKYTKWITVWFCLLGLAACRQDAPRFRIGVAQCSDDSWSCLLYTSPEAHKLAVEVSAYVCTQRGAMPELPQVLKDRLM